MTLGSSPSRLRLASSASIPVAGYTAVQLRNVQTSSMATYLFLGFIAWTVQTVPSWVQGMHWLPVSVTLHHTFRSRHSSHAKAKRERRVDMAGGLGSHILRL